MAARPRSVRSAARRFSLERRIIRKASSAIAITSTIAMALP